MLHYIYSQSLATVLLFMAAAISVWGYWGWKNHGRWRYRINCLLAAVSLVAILYTTILSRTPGTYIVILQPFATFGEARTQPELYREMLMNVFLFFPLGLTLSNAMSRKWFRWAKIILTTLIGCMLSAGIEYIQYRYALGMAEMDDVICNTLGAFIGSTSLLLSHAIGKYKERSLHKKMPLTTTETQFLNIAKAATTGVDFTPENVDWPMVFILAQEQKLLPILFETVCKTPAAEENAALFAVMKQRTIVQVLNQTVRSEEFTHLYRKLRTAGLHPIVVKGQLCSCLYPLKDHRISADDDLFIPDIEFRTCHELLLENGLTTDTPADELSTADEVSYTKNGSPLYIELHRHLFDSSENAHDELNHFFTDLHPIEIDGMLSMPPHEHLLYLVLHAYKHFVSRGVGLRQFCDIGLWAGKYHHAIDWQLLYDQCASVHAATFATAAFTIAREHLGIDFELHAPWNTPIDVEPLLHDTLRGGIYGSNDYTRLHSSTITLNTVKSSRKGEKSSVLRSVFPQKEYLERRYPYLKQYPILLPAAWVQRIAHYVSEKRLNTDNSAAGSIRLARERIELMKMYDIIE